MRRTLIFLIILASLDMAAAQTKRDPRSVGLSGAYTTIADGIFSVGVNPALIAFQREKPFMLQVAQFDLGFVGNYFSLSNLSSLSGDTLDTQEKDALFRQFDKSGGLTFFQDFHMPFPLLNYASGNMAFTSNLIFLTNFRIPAGLMKLLLYGNAEDPDIDMTFNYEILGVNEFGFSFAVPYESFAWGVTLKYLQGLVYLGVDPDSSHANLVTSDTGVYGQGTYYIRQGIGGSGIGLDIGFVTQEFNGWRVGASIINALGSITWNKPNMMKDILAGSDGVYGNKDDLYHNTWSGTALNDSMAVIYSYTIDTLSAQSLSNDSIFTSQTRFVKDLTADGKLKEFKMNYPTLFRIGISRRLPDLVMATDLVTGFEDRFFSRAQWTWSFGLESWTFPSFPLRLGYSWGGADFKELSMGFGLHKGPIIFDLGFAFRNGIWIHTMKGFNLSAGLTITSFRSRKDLPAEEPEPGPSPVPEETEESSQPG